MRFVGDLHLHSHYSIATSSELDLIHVARWAQRKGISVVGSGDIAHPGWLAEMREQLVPAEDGLFQLKTEYMDAIRENVPASCQKPVRFILGGEISNIYKKNDHTRKNHNLVFAPSFEAVEKLQHSLGNIGNIQSDGRPILGLDARDLLEIVLETDQQAYLIPAHIWTPWFSMLGSKSGFDSPDECFEDLTSHIFAVETGLSSDPPMNWRLSALDRFALVSNSDAHSPRKLAREANLFDTELSYASIFEAIQQKDDSKFLGTIEFHPQEGKYHYDGHRKCGVRWDPKTSLQHDNTCPRCGKPVTVGVMHRVEKLADRKPGEKPKHTLPFESLVPLPEILSEVHQVGPNTKTVRRKYRALLEQLGPELDVLRNIPLQEIENAGGVVLAEGIRRVREGKLQINEGFDGEFGVITLFEEHERKSLSDQMSFFVDDVPDSKAESLVGEPEGRDHLEPDDELDFPGNFFREEPEVTDAPVQESLFDEDVLRSPSVIRSTLNEEQRRAVEYTDDPLIIVAGPGTGKTRTLTHRMAYLVSEKGVEPSQILGITFTNKAAGEMQKRLRDLLGADTTQAMTICTFHAFGSLLLRNNHKLLDLDPDFVICSRKDQLQILRETNPELSIAQAKAYVQSISQAKNDLITEDSKALENIHPGDTVWPDIFFRYEQRLRKNHLLDYDDLLRLPIQMFDDHPEVLDEYQQQYQWISVDEYQDINYAQYQLLKYLTSNEANLCVIGDPDQAIYGFRGADRSYFLQFQEDFPGAKTVYLPRNYRSTKIILEASGQVIASGESRTNPAEMWTDIVSNTKVNIYQAATDKSEAEYVVRQIEKMVGGTGFFSRDSGRVDAEDEGLYAFSDFAILYRTNAQNRVLSQALERSGIPYQIVGDSSLSERKEVQEVLSYLWYLLNPRDSLALRRIINAELTGKAANSLAELLQDAYGNSDTDAEELPSAVIEKIEESLPILHQVKKRAPETSISGLIRFIWQSLIEKDNSRFTESRNEHIMKLVAKSMPHDNQLGEFLQEISLQTEGDLYDPRADRVSLSTIHAAKGLEFPVVFITGCEENLLPYSREGKATDVEEERRLFYVGMTRAQEKLILTHAWRRFLFGETLYNQPSKYLNDIEASLKKVREARRKKPAIQKQDQTQIGLFND